ncbi:MAG: hypothetical protein KC435_01475 [Thermomicrobiales bacterium]|nr:hypothetical protein [Thermomicrobiales bacterium]
MPSDLQPIVYIDSDVEQAAWIYATFGPDGTWQTVSQTMRPSADGTLQEILEIQPVGGESVFVPFMEASPDESLEGTGIDRTGVIEDVMHIAAQYAEANPPHHPGSLPRFPIPARSYEHALVVPMAILAVDDTGRRGLYAPPRQVVLSVTDNSLIGFGDFPGFDPEEWPPARVGDWPPHALSHMPEQQMQGVIQRFSCCWSRVLEAWFNRDGDEKSDVLRADVVESLRYRALLDAPGFEELYVRLNPEFERWLHS